LPPPSCFGWQKLVVGLDDVICGQTLQLPQDDLCNRSELLALMLFQLRNLLTVRDPKLELARSLFEDTELHLEFGQGHEDFPRFCKFLTCVLGEELNLLLLLHRGNNTLPLESVEQRQLLY